MILSGECMTMIALLFDGLRLTWRLRNTPIVPNFSHDQTAVLVFCNLPSTVSSSVIPLQFPWASTKQKIVLSVRRPRLPVLWIVNTGIMVDCANDDLRADGRFVRARITLENPVAN